MCLFSLNSVLYASFLIHSTHARSHIHTHTYTHTHLTAHTHIHTVIQYFALTYTPPTPPPQLVCMYVQSLGEERLCGVCVWWRVEQHGGMGVWTRVGVEGGSWVGRVAWLGQQGTGVVTLQRRHPLETWRGDTEDRFRFSM